MKPKDKKKVVEVEGEQIEVTPDGTLGGIDVAFEKDGRYYAFDINGELNCWFQNEELARDILTL
jgi:hypothetical protein